MKKEDLRKVVIVGENSTDNRKAYFHEFGITVYLTDDGKDFGVTRAIVEEIDTGLVFMVKPTDLKFID